MVISDYDKFDYNYQQYWKDRSYEHRSELMALRGLLKGVFGNFFLDVGGSYGRLVEAYYEKYENPVIIDFSLKTLQKNRDVLLKKYPRLNLVAANVYNPPFRNNVFDGALMVRVLHHIEQPEKYFKQLNRTMRSQGIYIQEFANKNHLKARIRALLKGNLRFFSQETFQQPTQGNFEGSNGQETVFLNFTSNFINRSLRENSFKIKKEVGASYLRIPMVKRLLPETAMLFLEMFGQIFLNWMRISPSIFIKAKLEKENHSQSKFTNLSEILVCPKCKGELNISDNKAECSFCNQTYSKKKDIWDFRVQ